MNVDSETRKVRINKKGVYKGWIYFGNYSATHDACIALRSDVEKMKHFRSISYSPLPTSGFGEENSVIYRGTHVNFNDDDHYDHFFPWPGHCHGRKTMIHPEELHGSPLHWACLSGQLEVVKILCEYPEIDLNATVEYYGVTGKDIAKKNKHVDVYRYLSSKMK